MSNILYIGEKNSGKTGIIHNYILDNCSTKKILFFSEDAPAVKTDKNITIVPVAPILRGYGEDYYRGEEMILYDSILGRNSLKTVLAIPNYTDNKTQVIATMHTGKKYIQTEKYLKELKELWGMEVVDFFNKIYLVKGLVKTPIGLETIVVPLKDDCYKEYPNMHKPY